jgi:hypothetical protein
VRIQGGPEQRTLTRALKNPNLNTNGEERTEKRERHALERWRVQEREIGVAPSAAEDVTAIADDDVAAVTHR